MAVLRATVNKLNDSVLYQVNFDSRPIRNSYSPLLSSRSVTEPQGIDYPRRATTSCSRALLYPHPRVSATCERVARLAEISRAIGSANDFRWVLSLSLRIFSEYFLSVVRRCARDRGHMGTVWWNEFARAREMVLLRGCSQQIFGEFFVIYLILIFSS